MHTLKLVTLFVLFLATQAVAQNSAAIDTLLNKSYDAYSDRNFDSAIDSAEKALRMAKAQNDTAAILRATFHKEIAEQVKQGNAYNLATINALKNELEARGMKLDAARAHQFIATIYSFFGNVQQELQEYLKSLALYEELDMPFGISAIYSDMSLMYYDQHDYTAAFAYSRKAIAMDREKGKPKKMHSDYNNLAIIFEHTGPLDSAIYYHKIALGFANQAQDPYGISLSLSNLGLNYTLAGDYQQAEKTLLKALRIRDSLGNYRGLAYTYNRLANLYIQQRQLGKAQVFANKSLNNAEHTSELKIKRMAYERLVEIADLKGDAVTAYYYFKKATALTDSLRNDSNTKALTQMAMQNAFDKEQFADSTANFVREVELQGAYEKQLQEERNTRNVSLAAGLLFLVLAIGAYQRSRYIKKSKTQLQTEKDRSDELLLNILPAEVAEELKRTGHSEARDFDRVTVLFTDFKAFTEIAEKLSAKELVTEINACFRAFDEIIDRHGIEKIKTIGDAYMAAGGLQVPRLSEARDVVLAALEMQQFMLDRKAGRDIQNLPAFDMRVGIHTGPVVAGIVGVKKFQYDIWGDTVNTANRMETNGQVGKVNISHATYELLKNDQDFAFESRGKIEAKGKGEMEMWFVYLKKD
jgi:class 3 adenylate cyclase